MTPVHPNFCQPFLATAITALLLAGTLAAAPLAGAAANPCASTASPALARRLGNAINSALSGRTGTESVGVHDRKRKITCWVRPYRRYDSASVVKVTVLGALLRWSKVRGRGLSAREKSLARAMITRSDNNATSTLWRSIGRTRIQRFVNLAKMTQTTLGPGGYWGLTRITARDEIRLLRLLTAHNTVLPDSARGYALNLMAGVIPSQRWGVPAGAPAAAGVHLKNGWLPRHDRYWRVHSIGSFDHGRDYMIVVLTQDTPTMSYGIRTIERVARAVHRNLNPGAFRMVPESAPGPGWERSDGSAVRP